VGEGMSLAYEGHVAKVNVTGAKISKLFQFSCKGAILSTNYSTIKILYSRKVKLQWAIITVL